MLDTDKLARIIWDYHHLHQPPEKADANLLFCSNDVRVVPHAVKLFLDGWAPLLIISGGISHQDDLLAEPWGVPPAEKFAEVAQKLGIPSDKIIIENKSTNTGENIQFTKALLKEKGIRPQKFIAVQKSYMERRAYAALAKQWPEGKFIMSSPNISFEEYPDEFISKDALINIMVGDLQRIKEYPALGFQIPQEIPPEVWDAYQKLIEAGYTKHLLR